MNKNKDYLFSTGRTIFLKKNNKPCFSLNIDNCFDISAACDNFVYINFANKYSLSSMKF